MLKGQKSLLAKLALLIILAGTSLGLSQQDELSAFLARLNSSSLLTQNQSEQTKVLGSEREAEHEFIPVRLKSIHDGDTLRLELLASTQDEPKGTEIKLRLIGIDAPEVNDPKTKENGRRSTEKLKELCKNKELYVQYGKERKDKYDRSLAYLWFSDTSFANKDKPSFDTSQLSSHCINYLMISSGYAEILERRPNTRYAREFAKAQELAKERKEGLWAAGDFRKFPDK